MAKFTSILLGYVTLAVTYVLAKDTLSHVLGIEVEWSDKVMFLGGLLFGITAIYRGLYNLYRWNFVMLKGLPGPPPASFIFGNMAQMFLGECDSVWYNWEKAYGHAYRMNGGFSQPILILTDPKGIAHVMNDQEGFQRSETTRQVLQTAFGGGIFTAEGPDHKRQRKPVSTAFTAPSVRELAPILQGLAQELREQWTEEIEKNDGQATVDVSTTISEFATDAISRTAFAYSIQDSHGPIADLLKKLGRLEDSRFTVFMQLVLDHFPILLSIPNPVSRRWLKLRHELGEVADDVWEKGVKEKGLESKVLDLIGKNQRNEAISQIVGILFAGSETTANIVAETLHKLVINPEKQKKLRTELQQHIESKGQITLEDLDSPNTLTYLDAVMKESLRALATVPHLSRKAEADAAIPLDFPVKLADGKVVQELKVKKGQTVLMPVRDGVNTCPEVWGKDAKKYRPERWLETGKDGILDKAKKIQSPHHIFTFGDGPRLCVGRIFAFYEFKILLSTLILNFEFSLSPEAEQKGIVFYLVGPTVKPKLKGHEREPAVLPLVVKLVESR